MNKKMSAAVICVCGFLSVLLFVTASSLTAHTPLFTVRMEQASSDMHFLPTSVESFFYSAENGYCLDYAVDAGVCAVPLEEPTGWATCAGQHNTCSSTCVNTCGSTCVSTCGYTCVNTCCTCVSTCPYTCQNTCGSTCGSTCPYTCWESCSAPCP